MDKYSYVVKFKTTENSNYLYNMRFIVEANTNKEAVVIGQEKWKEQLTKREKLQKASIKKVICRKIPDEPRQPKRTQLQKALDALNQYMLEDLSK